MQDLPVQGFWAWWIKVCYPEPLPSEISDKLDMYCSLLQPKTKMMKYLIEVFMSSLQSAYHLGLFFSREMCSEWVWRTSSWMVDARAGQSTYLFEQEPTAVFSPLHVHFVILFFVDNMEECKLWCVFWSVSSLCMAFEFMLKGCPPPYGIITLQYRPCEVTCTFCVFFISCMAKYGHVM